MRVRVYISCDIEGVAGITNWDEARKTHADYEEFRRQMTAEARAACEGALAAGASSITVKDAHASARNLLASELPPPTQLIRGWSGHPYLMVQGIDDSYDAAAFIGYHARAGAGGNPLAHTISGSAVHEIRINGEPCSEYRIHALAAALVGVPVVFVAGDQTLCEEVAEVQPHTRTFATKWGEGRSQTSVHPEHAIAGIRGGMQTALRGELRKALLELPPHFSVELTYKEHAQAHAKSFYPGAERVSPHVVRYEADDYFEVLRAVSFLI